MNLPEPDRQSTNAIDTCMLPIGNMDQAGKLILLEDAGFGKSPGTPQFSFHCPSGTTWMWCAVCQSDVVAELSTDHRLLRCTSCGADVGSVDPVDVPQPRVANAEAERSARDLLARWTAENLLELRQRTQVSTAPQIRVDLPHREAIPQDAKTVPHPVGSLNPSSLPMTGEVSMTESAPQPETTSPPPHEMATPAPRASAESAVHAERPQMKGPHFRPKKKREFRLERSHLDRATMPMPIVAPPTAPASPRASWSNIIGQICAYLGVGILTSGTALVLWGYFGGPEVYAPTGWLMSTVGQMLLFLGVVTLISSGLEQTTQEVATRIESLGDKLLRIEHAHHQHELRGPHFRIRGGRQTRQKSREMQMAGSPGRAARSSASSGIKAPHIGAGPSGGVSSVKSSSQATPAEDRGYYA